MVPNARQRPRRACAARAGKKRSREDADAVDADGMMAQLALTSSRSGAKRARKGQQQPAAPLMSRSSRNVSKRKAANRVPARARKSRPTTEKSANSRHPTALNAEDVDMENSNPNTRSGPRVLPLSPRKQSKQSVKPKKPSKKSAAVVGDGDSDKARRLQTSSKIKSNTKIQIGNLTRRWGKNVTEMRDSTQLFLEERWSELASRLDADGFVLIRGAIPREACRRARERVFSYLDEIEVIDSSVDDKLKGVIGKTDDNTYEESFAVKAHCGAEASERDFDPDVWKTLGNCEELTSVYKSEHLYSLLRSILGAPNTNAADADSKSSSSSSSSSAADGNSAEEDKGITLCPLTHQTWVRLMTNRGATIEHADYYYFKKDTQIFDRDSGFSGVNVQDGELDEKSQRTMLKPRFVSEDCAVCGASAGARAAAVKKSGGSNSDLNKCTLCGVRSHTKCMPERLQKALSLKHFAAEGGWHCEKCAQSNFGVYTTWLCVSDALTPSNSSLAMCPETHRLKGFNEPKYNTQVPKDFKASLKWQIPSKLNMGDLILFNIKTIHAASVNVSKFFRFSIDTRFMLKCKHSGDLVQQVPSDLTEHELFSTSTA